MKIELKNSVFKQLNKELLELAKEYKDIDDKEITLGVHDTEGAVPHPDGKHGESVVDIAAANYYGVPEANYPARPYIKNYIDQNEKQILDEFDEVISDFVKAKTLKKQFNVDFELEAIANELQEELKDHMRTKEPQVFGNATPLFETGALIDAIKGKLK